MTSNQEIAGITSLGIIPNPLKMMRALIRPNQPFVMINMLSFKQQATGEFADLSGQESYEVYAKSVEEVQGPLGSRLLWSGQVLQDMLDSNQPAFHTIGLLEYASPKAFLQANFRGKTNTKARSAGLRGQWLIASTTQEINNMPEHDEDHVVLFEMSGSMEHSPGHIQEWHRGRKTLYGTVGAKTIWSGSCDHHILGAIKPEIEDVLVTWFPGQRSLTTILNDSYRKTHQKSLSIYLAYTAFSSDILPTLRQGMS